MKLKVPGLLSDTKYAIQVRTQDNGKNSEWGPIFFFQTIDTDGVGPKVPTNVTWTSSGEIFYGTWDPVTKNTANEKTVIARYEIELSTPLRPQNSVKVDSVTANTSTDKVKYTLTLEKNRAFFGIPNATIAMRVRAVDNNGSKSDWSDSITAGNAPPDTPQNFTAEGVVDGIVLKWDASVATDIIGYEIFTDLTPNFTPSPAGRIFTGLTTTFTYPTGTYVDQYFQLFAVDTFGSRSAPATAQGKAISPYGADTTPPNVPTGLTVSSTITGNTATANLTWTFDSTATANKDIQSFAIRWRKVGSANWYVDFISKDSRSIALNLPQPYADYEFQIASVDSVANYSDWSASATLSNSIPGPPPQTTGLTGTSGIDSLQLKWDASTAGDVTNGGVYQLDVATDSAFSNIIYTVQTGTNNISINGLSSNTTFYTRVKAIDVTGQSGSYSSTFSISTKNFPTPALSDGYKPGSSPTPTVTPGIGYLQVSWSPVATNSNGGAQNDLVTYEVHGGTTSGFTVSSSTKIAEITGTLVNLEKDATGTAFDYTTTYYFKTVAKDVDGAAAASTASAGGTPVKAQSYDISSISVAQLTTGSILGATFTLDTGGIIKSANYDATNQTGFALTANSLVMYDGTVDAKVLRSGSSITNSLSVTGNMTIASSGTIRSTNYSDGSSTAAAGFSLSSVGLDIRSGNVAANTLTSGTISSANIYLGAGGGLYVSSTGFIQSNNYVAGSTGWKLDANGITFYNPNGYINAANVNGDTVSGRLITVTSGGSVQSSNWNGSSTGWQLAYNGFTMYNGFIKGATVQTNQLYSLTPDSNAPNGYRFSINSSGYAEFAGANIYGNTTVGNGSQHYVQTTNFNAGAATTQGGWKLTGDGQALFNNATIYGGYLTIGVGANTSYPNSKISIVPDASGGQIRLYSGHPNESVPGKINPEGGGTNPGLFLVAPTNGGGVAPYIRMVSTTTATSSLSLLSEIINLQGGMGAGQGVNVTNGLFRSDYYYPYSSNKITLGDTTNPWSAPGSLKMGQISATLSAGPSFTTYNVTFSPQFNSNAQVPVVMVNCQGSPGNYSAAVYNISRTGCTIQVNRASGTGSVTFPVDWIAITQAQ